MRFWDPANGRPGPVFTGHTDAVLALAFRPGDDVLVTASDDSTIRGIGPDDGLERLHVDVSRKAFALAFSPDGSLLAAGDDWGRITLRDRNLREVRRLVKVNDATIRGLAFSPDGRRLAGACDDGKVRCWDVISGQLLLELAGHEQRVNAVAFSPDGGTLASVSHDHTVRLWRSGGQTGTGPSPLLAP